jgi:hypothetical protein
MDYCVKSGVELVLILSLNTSKLTQHIFNKRVIRLLRRTNILPCSRLMRRGVKAWIDFMGDLEKQVNGMSTITLKKDR